jgi:hypothetical protein
MRHATTSLLLLSLAACSTTERVEGFGPDLYKAWADNGSPSLLSSDLEYKLSELPDSGAAESAPWAANYWPTYRDSINHKWQGADSTAPSTKYAQAFGREDLEDRVSAQYGIDSINGETCTEDDQCNSDAGEKCSKRDGEEEGTCIETWFGICHAWAPAAIMEKEPLHDIDYNGVNFRVNDIKALVTASYDKGLDVKFMSLRCNERATGDDAMEFDELGNPTSDACDDTNPGAFHVVIANFIGLQERSLVEDRTFDYEVWNQPIRAYEITQNAEVTPAEANALLGQTEDVENYAFNTDAATLRHVKLNLDWIAESDYDVEGNLASTIDKYTHTDRYQYILEIDADGKIIGGEWVGDSKKSHPDFLWLPTVKRDTEVATDNGQAGTGIKWSEVQQLLFMSRQVDEEESTGFDWGNLCDDGSGEFQQPIEDGSTVTVGTIPDTKMDVRIELTSDADVDIQLIDTATGTELIAWPNGLIADSEEGCSTFEGVEFCYSGYNGDGTNLGHEWIEVRGATQRDLEMRAYGYAAGDAQVDYSWKALPDCVDTGDGEFTTFLQEQQVTEVGSIPAGKDNVRIELESSADVDIQLFDGDTALVQWPNGRLNGAGESSFEYNGVTVTYSGYNGNGTNLGHEFISIEGELQSEFTMKAFGYQTGTADVKYAWGVDDVSADL